MTGPSVWVAKLANIVLARPASLTHDLARRLFNVYVAAGGCRWRCCRGW
ncbi:MAG: hypothetical protein R3A10_02705 [Caldilineaceae bacterium]